MSNPNGGPGGGGTPSSQPPNILILTVDEMRYPRFGYGPDAGMLQPIKEILGFVGDPGGNPYAKYFPGFLGLRKNAVVLKNHTIASSACTPSRGTIYTGQYSTRTGLTQTDGVFKSGSDPAFPWLDPTGVPTMGDWFRAAGYTTHYFGKWHVSDAHEGSLEPWGWSDWELSTPEPHGSYYGNLGIYRDHGFTDNTVTFLHRKALAVNTTSQPAPWLAVCSLTNPHDIAGYPMPWFSGVEPPTLPWGDPRPIPVPGATSGAAKYGSWHVPLNPDGFPQDTFNPSPTQDEDLSTKPDCQLDSAYKVGLALKSRWIPGTRQKSPLPFQLSGDNPGWQLANGQFYTYLHYLVDLQVRRVVQAVQDTGLMENTILVFYSDHGDYAGAHGGMVQKWHTAYAESLHVPCVVCSPAINPDAGAMRYVDELTSHIDMIPTLLGLAGFDADARAQLAQRLSATQDPVYPLVGADLSGVIRGTQERVVEADGQLRRAVLFITDDTITQPLPNEVGNHQYQYFLADVAQLADSGEAPIRRGSVVQPCHVQAVKSHEWKLARYWDPVGNAADQWELYSQVHDPNEAANLVGWTADGKAYVRAEQIPPAWNLSAADVERALHEMQRLLADYCARMLSVTDPSDEGEGDPRRKVKVGAGFVVHSSLEEGAIAP